MKLVLAGGTGQLGQLLVREFGTVIKLSCFLAAEAARAR